MKANIVTQTARALYDQMLNVKEAEKENYEMEAFKLASMSQGAEQIAALAEQEVKLIIGTNIIPQDSLLVSEVKAIHEKPYKKLLADDFTKETVKD